jgi:tripartite-type tricarboxylate transporter receptor subunit TctC
MASNTTPKMIALALGVVSMCPSILFAQGWPSKPIRMIVPFPPGGGTDFIGRVVGQRLADRLGQQVVIDNRGGANGIVGLEILKISPPDGYTIAAVPHGPLSINPLIYSKLPYDSLRDFAPIANMVNVPLLLVTHPSLPVKNVRELIALAKKEPGKLAYSSQGAGNSGHLAAELFDSMARVKMIHVPYKGTGPANMALLGGEVQLTYSSIPTVLQHVRAGKLRALGVGNAKRIASLPEFPTIAESGLPSYEAYAWTGMVAPANTPKDIITRINREIVQIIKQKDVADQLLKEGMVPTPSTAEEFGAYIEAEIEKWGPVVKQANIRAE